MYVFELVGEDDEFASFEAACLASEVHLLGPGVAIASDVGGRVGQIALTHRIDEYVADTPLRIAAARRALQVADIDRFGSAAVRARTVRGAELDTQRMERELGDVLVARGFSIDLDAPDHVLRAVGTGDTCVLGWLDQTPHQSFANRRPTDRPYFQPGSMAPRLARALVNIAGGGPECVLLDPMCGTGGILIEAGLVGSQPIGGDVDSDMLDGTRRNLSAACPSVEWGLVRGDASALPMRTDSVDAVVFDAPYGRQSAVASRDPVRLVEDALTEAQRVGQRAVAVTDRPIVGELPAGWECQGRFERRVHRSLTRYIHLFGPSGAFPGPVTHA